MNDDISGLCPKSYLNATCSTTWTFETLAPSNECDMRNPSLVILNILKPKQWNIKENKLVHNEIENSA